MTAMCKLFLALGFSHLSCEPPAVIELPPGDTAVFEYAGPVEETVPEPPPEAPEPPEVRVVERIVYVPVETEEQNDDPGPDPLPAPEPVPRGFDVAAVERIYQRRLDGELGTGIQQETAPLVPAPGAEGGSASGGPAPAAPFPQPARYNHPGLAGGDPVDNARILAEDRYITGNLETSINTQLDGSVIIQTSRDVFGYHGQRILLAKGSRMVCDYEAPKKIGEHRIRLTCNRVLTASHRAEIYEVAAPVGDVQGRAGITGDVDNRFLESYGSAFVLTFISASVRAAVASSRDAGSDDTDKAIISEAGEEISTRFGEITASVLQRTLNLKPIITVPQGTRVQIRPASDWYIRPVVEN